MDLKELLGEELYSKVKEKIGDKELIVNDGSYIPKAKFDEINEQRKLYKQQAEDLNKQLDDMKKQVKGNEELQNRIQELQTKLQESEGKIKDVSISAAIKMAAMKANAKDPDIISMLIDKSKLNIKEDGSIEGLDEQLQSIAESKAFLFGDVQTKIGGASNPPGGANPTVKNPWAKETFNLTEQAKILKENPALAEQLKAAAGVK
ncbi:phage scaffolding protein [Tepidibacillus fermentans]|uniref:Minor structural protein GP20 n=1 Tax=Tepidibacillus fermentans TaxID=1281767 RepID=A0A4R3K7F7_9BACI|nr:phage scaffolding protein [Tepidibacillus fermentans]TCS78777.1 minor structural protein GP20 [Tepidibacillus fermentans]